ncbi:hypothetical protein J4233_02715 [Candidatus Pacearchaeota archaeon]|nr:hypothetical protein [Candidatus Pacearchaeota archaeon]
MSTLQTETCDYQAVPLPWNRIDADGNYRDSQPDIGAFEYASSPAIKTAIINASRTSCVAPCAVFFDGIGELSWKDIEEHRFDWDFGAGTESDVSSGGRNFRGYMAAHVYETPGIYNVSLKMYKNNIFVEEDKVTVNILPFNGRTICVSQAGDFVGCPSGNAGDHYTIFADAYAIRASGMRILFHRGDKYYINPNGDNTNPSFFKPTFSHVYLGAYGDSDLEKPLFANASFSIDNTTMNDLHLSGQFHQSLDGQIFTNYKSVLILRTELGPSNCDHQGIAASSEIFIVDSTIHDLTGDDVTQVCSYTESFGTFFNGAGAGAILNSIIENVQRANLRTYKDKILIANNLLGYPHTNPNLRLLNKWNLVSNNTFYSEADKSIVTTPTTADGNIHPEKVDSNSIIEKNNFNGMSRPGYKSFAEIGTNNAVIRNNFGINPNTFVKITTLYNSSDYVINPANNVSIYGNTVYSYGLGSIAFVDSQSRENILVQNNLIVSQAYQNINIPNFVIDSRGLISLLNESNNLFFFKEAPASLKMYRYNNVAYNLSVWKSMGYGKNSGYMDVSGLYGVPVYSTLLAIKSKSFNVAASITGSAGKYLTVSSLNGDFESSGLVTDEDGDVVSNLKIISAQNGPSSLDCNQNGTRDTDYSLCGAFETFRFSPEVIVVKLNDNSSGGYPPVLVDGPENLVVNMTYFPSTTTRLYIPYPGNFSVGNIITLDILPDEVQTITSKSIDADGDYIVISPGLSKRPRPMVTIYKWADASDTKVRLYPKSTSMTIDAGTPLPGLFEDFYGNLRIGTPDVGAFEYQSISSQTGAMTTASRTSCVAPCGVFFDAVDEKKPIRVTNKLKNIKINYVSKATDTGTGTLWYQNFSGQVYYAWQVPGQEKGVWVAESGFMTLPSADNRSYVLADKSYAYNIGKATESDSIVIEFYQTGVVQPKGFINESIKGIDLVYVGSNTPSGIGRISYNSGIHSLSWKAPGESYGLAIVVSNGGLFELYSGNGQYTIKVWVESAELPISDVEENIEIISGDTNAKWTDFYHQWDFGDPASGNWNNGARLSDGSYPSKNSEVGWVAAHVYENPGTYNVKLKTIDDLGQEHNYTQSINVLAEPSGGWITYYFAASGSDSNPCSQTQPCQTWSKAMTLAGTNVKLLFNREDSFSFSGSLPVLNFPGPFYIGAYGEGERPKLISQGGASLMYLSANESIVSDLWIVGDYPNNDNQAGTFGAFGEDSLALRIKVQGMGYNAFSNTGENVLIQDCETESGKGYSLFSGAHRVAMQGCNLKNGTEWQFRSYSNFGTIAHNTFSRQSTTKGMARYLNSFWVQAIGNLFTQSNALQSFALMEDKGSGVNHAIIYGNEFSGDGSLTSINAIGLQGARDVLVASNRLYGNSSSMSLVTVSNGGDSPTRVMNNLFLVGNTYSYTGQGSFSFLSIGLNFSEVKNIQSYNNIIYAANATAGQLYGVTNVSSPFLKSDKNIIYIPKILNIINENYATNRFNRYNLSKWQSLGKDLNSISLDPSLVNPSVGDLRLQSNSLAINAGSVDYLPWSRVDADGNYRDSQPDIGAYEYQSGTVCGNGIVEGTEVCDGNNLNGQTCQNQGFGGGTLACNAQCNGLVTTGCTSSCTNECSTSGAKQCSGTLDYQICGNYDADSCLEWSSAAACGTTDCDYLDTQCRNYCSMEREQCNSRNASEFECSRNELQWEAS